MPNLIGRDNMKTCFLFGHREADEKLRNSLENAVEHCITDLGIEEFVVGAHGGFDWLAASTIKKLKAKYPHVTLTLLLHYHPAERIIERANEFDGTFYPPGLETVPRRYAIVKGNRYMVAHSDCVIAYVTHPASNSRELLGYARSKQIHIVNLGIDF